MAKITGSEQSLFVREYTRGASFKHLATRLGRSVATLQRWRRRFGLPTRVSNGTGQRRYVGFHVSATEHSAIARLAHDAGLSVSELMRRLAVQAVNRGDRLTYSTPSKR